MKLAPNNARMRKNHGGSLARLAIDNQNTNSKKMEQYARQAIVELQAGLDIYPNIPTGYIHMGNMHILLKQYDQAVANFETALEMAPNNYYARSSLANVYYRQGRYGAAIETLQYIDIQDLSDSDRQVIELSRAALSKQ